MKLSQAAFLLFSFLSSALFLPARALAVAERAADAAGIASMSTAQATGVNTISHNSSLFSWGSYFQALAVLFFLVALLWGALWYIKNKGGLKLLSDQGDLAVENRLSIGPKKSLMVVRFLNKMMVLVVTEQNIRLLTEMEAGDEKNTTTFQELMHAQAKNLDDLQRQSVDSAVASGPGAGS